jgi:hypothetical protein
MTYVGTIGIYLFLASLMCTTRKFAKLLDMAENYVLAIYFTLDSYLFLFLNISQRFSIPIAIMYGIISLSFLNGIYRRQALLVAIFMSVFIDLFIYNIDTAFWTSKFSIHFWMQINLISDNVCLIFGLSYMFLFETYVKLKIGSVAQIRKYLNF